MARYQLRVIEGPDAGCTFTLPTAGSVIVGSSHRHADLWLHDPKVAKVHCQVDVSARSASVIELDPRKGVIVNKERVTKAKLRQGRSFTIGDTVLVFEQVPPEHSDLCEVVEDNAKKKKRAKHGARPAPPEPEPLTGIRALRGTVFGHYAVGKLLANGRSGCVYRGLHLDSGIPVALKILRPEFPANDAEAKRFLQSVEAGAKLRHPNLVTVLGGGRDEQYAWIALQLVVGKGLQDLLHVPGMPRMRPWKEVLRMGIQLAQGLHHAHRAGWLHGHLTPQDVLVLESGEIAINGVVLAHAIAGSDLQKEMLKEMPVASWCYFAPEQTKSLRAVSEHSDLYGMGAVLYTALTGKPPCLRRTQAETINCIRAGPPFRPKDFQFAIPDAMDLLVLRLLSKQPTARGIDAATVRMEFEEIAAAEGVLLT